MMTLATARKIVAENTRSWHWTTFRGEPVCITLSARDLAHVEIALSLCREPDLKRRGVAVQAGGNVGMFPRYLSQRLGAVHTFEPCTMEALRTNTLGCANITAHELALWDSPCRVGMVRERRYKTNRPAHDGVTYAIADPDGGTLATTIDGLNLSSCDLIYLDIEGAELRALMGAAATLDRCRPVVGLEVNDCITFTEGPQGVAMLDAFMRKHNYVEAGRIRSDVLYIPMEHLPE